MFYMTMTFFNFFYPKHIFIIKKYAIMGLLKNGQYGKKGILVEYDAGYHLFLFSNIFIIKHNY